MDIRNKLVKGAVYLQLLTAMLGCAHSPAGKAPFFPNKRTESQLESRLQVQPPYPYSHYKVREAQQDIEQILALDFMRKLYLNQNSALICDYITPMRDSNLYMFRYSIGDDVDVQYYCKKNHNEFERYAREISFNIRSDPYFVQIKFLGKKSKWVNPSEQMQFCITKYEIKVGDGVQPKMHRARVDPKTYLI